MKFYVTVEGERFEVEIADSRTRPVVAVVDDVRYEVDVQEGADSPVPPVAVRPVARVSTPTPAAAVGRDVVAPMPGVIVEVAVKAGDRVEPRQPLVVLESMKMKNVIRATVSATVEAVLVTAGEHVNHRDVLVTYGR